MTSREQPTVPSTEFRSYYGRPILKEPTWRSPDVPLYFFLGGLSGASATMAVLADGTGRHGLARTERYLAAGGAAASLVALIHDLGRPARFLNMLRVFKPSSPLSVGSWILASFSAAALAAAVSDRTGVLTPVGRLAGGMSAVLGPAMCTYTAVLLSDTAVPAWHECYRELPWVFGGSALAGAGGAALLAAPADQHGPARRVAACGAGMEIAAGTRLERRGDLVTEPYRRGRPAKLLKYARVLTAAGAGLAVAAGMLSGRTGRVVSASAGSALLAGGLCTRFGIFEAGRASSRDPKYVVVPQRERLAARTTHHERADG